MCHCVALVFKLDIDGITGLNFLHKILKNSDISFKKTDTVNQLQRQANYLRIHVSLPFLKEKMNNFVVPKLAIYGSGYVIRHT